MELRLIARCSVLARREQANAPTRAAAMQQSPVARAARESATTATIGMSWRMPDGAMLIGAGVTGANVDGAVVDGPSVGANVGANVVDAVGALVDGAIVGVAELLPLPNAVSATANVVKNLILEASYEDSPSIRTSGQP
jgi:hypothetical protein